MAFKSIKQFNFPIQNSISLSKKNKNIIINLDNNNSQIDSLIIDYCTICDNLILNKYSISHCNKCNLCHKKHKLHCNKCNLCYHPLDDNDLIIHRNRCINKL